MTKERASQKKSVRESLESTIRLNSLFGFDRLKVSRYCLNMFRRNNNGFIDVLWPKKLKKLLAQKFSANLFDKIDISVLLHNDQRSFFSNTRNSF